MREIAVRIPSESVEAVLDELLLLAPHGVFEVARGDEVELRVRGTPDELPPAEAVAAATRGWEQSIRERDVPDDWHERRAADHEPLRVGGRLVVRPSWAPPARDDLIDIVLEDAGAFGAGTHPTTRACLEAICALEPDGGFADLGCGSGLLAIAAARLGWAPVVAIDRDPEAVAATAANAARNGVTVSAHALDLATRAPPSASTFVANVPLAVHETIGSLLVGAPETLILSGVLEEDATQAAGAYSATGLREAERIVTSGWALLVLRA